ncbi:putative glycosyltransferase AER61, partial [Ophiophagus hannah]
MELSIHASLVFPTAMLILVMLGALFPKIVARGPDEHLHNGSNVLQEPRYPYESIMLSEEHIPYFLHNNPGIATACRQDPLCPYKKHLKKLKACWGYEKSCKPENRFGYPTCDYAEIGWANTIEQAQDIFWKQADFGYVKEKMKDVKNHCKPKNAGDSSLECSRYLQYCKAANLYIDLRHPERNHDRFNEDFFKKGQIGGHCSMNTKAFLAEGQQKSPLQSWYKSTYGYGDLFSETWKAFTDYEIIHLKSYDSKRVCFKEAVFTLLPRMRFGLFYNTPLISGCHGTGLFRAFSQHDGKIRVTILARTTEYRKILNQNELANALKTLPLFDVQIVNYKYKYNCKDERCYLDLARLRGIHYITWQQKDKVFPQDEGHHPTLGKHPKFTNYAFDVEEFVRLVLLAADHVSQHSKWPFRRKHDEF